MEFLLLLMLSVGTIQVAWAISLSRHTKRKKLRRHLRYYGDGVIVYFAILFLILWFFYSQVGYFVLRLHFFGSASALACYHIYIIWMHYQSDQESDEVEVN